MTEEELIEKNWNFIYLCAWKFIREVSLPASARDDAFQEARIAYLMWHRKMVNGDFITSDGNGEWLAANYIRFHLFKKIQRERIRTIAKAKRGIVQTQQPRSFDDVYVSDWIDHLPDDQKRIVTHLLKTGKPNVQGLSLAGYYRRKKKIRESFDKYFMEAG